MQGVLTERIEYKNGKLEFLGESKNGRGYNIHQGKMEIHIKGLNVNEKYEIDFDEDNAILTIGDNKYVLPLDILSYSDLINNSKKVEDANKEIAGEIGIQLRKRKANNT